MFCDPPRVCCLPPSANPLAHHARQKKVPAYCPPSDFRVNVEAGLRTALSLGLTFVWLRFGPFEGGLSFFAGVTAVVCVGNSAGQTISRSLVSVVFIRVQYRPANKRPDIWPRLTFLLLYLYRILCSTRHGAPFFGKFSG